MSENWRVIGFDIERHEYGEHRYAAQLVIQDVLTLHGSQFRDAALIVASPPCTEYSWMAMPWSRAKQVARALRGEGDFPEGYRGSRTVADLNRLFDACFRIQREASAAAGRHIPMVVENVMGAQPWVGRARWSYGSFYLWGDVPALMPWTQGRILKHGVVDGVQNGVTNFHRDKCKGGRNTTSGKGRNPDGRRAPAGTRWFNDGPRTPDSLASMGSKSPARKFASAIIAKIPLNLSRWIARAYLPQRAAA